MTFIGVEERRACLAVRHRLLPQRRTDDVVGIADDLVALHSTDPVTVFLSLMLRMRRPSIAAVEDALYERRSLIRHHAMRRTLWLARPETVRLMHAAATRKLVAPERRRLLAMLRSAGIEDPDAWLADARAEILADLHRHGPSTAREIGQRVAGLRHPLQLAPGKAYAAVQGAHTRVLTLLGFEGAVLRARPVSWITGAYRYAAAEEWLPGGLGDGDERAAAATLAEAYLRRFGPVTTADVQWWMGWTLAATRRALADAGAVAVETGSGSGVTAAWVAAGDQPVSEVPPWVALLPGLDPTIMGWKQRDWYLPARAREVFDSTGNGGPSIWVDGRVVGAWAQDRAGEIHLHYCERVAVGRRREIADRVAELKGMVGDTRFSVRFPGDIHARLLG